MKSRMRTMVSDAVLVTACCAVVWVLTHAVLMVIM